MATNIAYEPQGVYCTYSGDTGMHELLTAIEILVARPEVDEFRYVIHDCSSAQNVALQEDALTMVSAQAIGMAFSNNKLRSALVTTDPRILTMLSQYSSMTGREVAVFETPALARAWATALRP